MCCRICTTTLSRFCRAEATLHSGGPSPIIRPDTGWRRGRVPVQRLLRRSLNRPGRADGPLCQPAQASTRRSPGMLRPALRSLSAALSSAAALLLVSGPAYAEVSDKVPSIHELWLAGLAAGVVCAAAGWFRHRLLWVLLPLAALFFVSLLLEIHAPDVGAALYREQGGCLLCAGLSGIWSGLAGGLDRLALESASPIETGRTDLRLRFSPRQIGATTLFNGRLLRSALLRRA